MSLCAWMLARAVRVSLPVVRPWPSVCGASRYQVEESAVDNGVNARGLGTTGETARWKNEAYEMMLVRHAEV
jgi:hypothetical protein